MTVAQPIAGTLVRRFLDRLSTLERRLFIGFALSALLAGGLIINQYRLSTTHTVPANGGLYTEGIVAGSLADVTPTLDALTSIGLLRQAPSGELAPAAATAWQVSPDGKTYTFALANGVDVGTVRSTLSERKDLFADIGVEVSDDGAVVFTLKQPFSPFLTTTTTPIFPYGPYKIAKQEKGIVRLEPNPHSLVGQPYLQGIVLRIYPDSFNLTQALSGGEIDGVSDTTAVENDRLLRSLHTYQVTLPRAIYLFFNTSRDSVKRAELRTKLKENQPVEGNPELHLVTLSNPKYEQLAQQQAAAWGKLGVRVTIETRTASELARDIVPNRAYDALIYGLDFGLDPDPYPFWHSSQISREGLNLANFANIDADRLLEKARQTSDEAERAKLYEQFKAIFDREVPAIELEKVTATFGVSNRIQGIQSHPGASVADRYDLVAQWYRKTKRVRN